MNKQLRNEDLVNNLCRCQDFNRESKHWIKTEGACSCRKKEVHYHCPNCGGIKVMYVLRYLDIDQKHKRFDGCLRECTNKLENVRKENCIQEMVIVTDPRDICRIEQYTLTLD